MTSSSCCCPLQLLSLIHTLLLLMLLLLLLWKLLMLIIHSSHRLSRRLLAVVAGKCNFDPFITLAFLLFPLFLIIVFIFFIVGIVSFIELLLLLSHSSGWLFLSTLNVSGHFWTFYKWQSFIWRLLLIVLLLTLILLLVIIDGISCASLDSGYRSLKWGRLLGAHRLFGRLGQILEGLFIVRKSVKIIFGIRIASFLKYHSILGRFFKRPKTLLRVINHWIFVARSEWVLRYTLAKNLCGTVALHGSRASRSTLWTACLFLTCSDLDHTA